MKILHIVNSYGGTAVYTNLFTAIDKCGEVSQSVYVPLSSRNHNRIGEKMINFIDSSSSIHYSTVLKSYHRLFYTLKIKTVVKDVESQFSVNDYDVIHAGTAFFDGAVAFELSKKYKKPYIVTVRDTDVNTYYNKLFFKHNYFHKVLLNSSEIVFISPRYKNDFLSNIIPHNISEAITHKAKVRTNGVDHLFLDNLVASTKILHNPIRLLFSGAFIDRKGLIEAIEAAEILKGEGIDIQFIAVGKGLPFRGIDKKYIKQVETLALKHKWLILKDFKPLRELIKEMRDADIFVMSSHTETFGLCYVEALTQALPVLYSRGQGFDGQFKEGFIGVSADSHNPQDIANGIKYIIYNYTTIQSNIKDAELNVMFNWNNIAQGYVSLYKQITK